MVPTARCSWNVGGRLLWVGAVTVALLWFPAPARAGVGQASQAHLKADLATLLKRPASAVVAMHGFDLKGVRGVNGAAVGIYRSKNGKHTHAALVVYFKQRRKSMMTIVWLHGAKSVAPVALVDLAARRTKPRLSGYHGRYRSVRSLGKRGQWLKRPALLLETRSTYGGSAHRKLLVISLKPAQRPHRLGEVETRSVRIKLRRMGKGRVPYPRFKGTRVESIVFRRKGRDIEMVVTKRLVSTRYNRCRRPKPRREVFRLKKGRFQRLPTPSSSFKPC